MTDFYGIPFSSVFPWREYYCFSFFKVTTAPFAFGTWTAKPASKKSPHIERNLMKRYTTWLFILIDRTLLARARMD